MIAIGTVLLAGLLATGAQDEDAKPLRVVYVGNALVEHAAHHGYLEAALTQRWKDRDVTFRNLGWAGDTVAGRARVGFGPTEADRSAWKRPGEAGRAEYAFSRLVNGVRDAKPDILIVAYGSEAADESVAQFGKDLEKFLDAAAKDVKRLVLLSPIRRERPAPELPDPTRANENLARAAAILEAAAKRRDALFVDLFHDLRPGDGGPLTDNGIHPNEQGYLRIARLVADRIAPLKGDWMLRLGSGGKVHGASGAKVENVEVVPLGLRFDVRDHHLPLAGDRRVVKIEGLKPARYTLSANGNPLASGTHEEWLKGVVLGAGPETAQAESLRQVIVSKNRLFRFGDRPQNKAYILLFRKHEREDHAEELKRFAVLARAKEEEIARLRHPRTQQYVLMREKAYPDHEVPKNVPMPDPVAELAAMKVDEGVAVNLYAANPMVANPIQATWDERGRMWVATSTTYPHLRPGDAPDDKIVILEDTDGDGDADTSTVFADGLLIPHSLEFGEGGVYVTECTEVIFLKDTDGDDRADVRKVVFSGFGNADLHHTIHGLTRGPDGLLYFLQSIYINSYVETPWGPRLLGASGFWAFDAPSMKLEVYARGMVNPWGFVWDRYGQTFATDGAGGGGLTYVIPGGTYKTADGATRTLKELNPGHPKNCGLEVISGRHFPESWRGTMVTGDFRANRINRFRPVEDGSGFASRRENDLIVSAHRSFRPVQMRMGPDGALYVMDWYSPVIDHGEVNFHHPARDHKHGRIWRVTAKGRPLVTPPKLDGVPASALLDALKEPEDWTRQQARRLLREMGRDAVMPALKAWVKKLDASHPDFEHHRLEALWLTQALKAVDADLLRAVARSKDGRVRAAAVRVGAPAEKAIADDHPRVRLEAIHKLREEGSPRSIEVALRALDRPMDTVLDYALWLAAESTKETWLPEFKAGRISFGGNPAHAGFALRAAKDPAGLKPLVALLREGKVAAGDRAGVMTLVAELGGPAELNVIFDLALKGDDVALDALVGADGKPSGDLSRIVPLVEKGRGAAARLAGAWKVEAARGAIEKLAAGDAEAAADGLAMLGGPKSREALLSWTGKARLAAARGLVRIDVKAAAELAVKSMGEGDPTALVEAFLRHPKGTEALTAALAGATLPASAASIGARLADSSGRDLKALVNAFRKAGALAAPTAMPEGAALQKFLDDVARGDAAKGEAVFRRKDLACQKCHAVAGAGGNVGPDLAGIGAHSPPAYLLESVLAPSRKLKEGYETLMVRLKDGTILTGTKAGQTGTHLLLRGSDGETHPVPLNKIGQSKGGTVSVMPTGLAQGLGRDELVDLVTFLSQLGRDPRFSISPARVVRRWRSGDERVYSTVAGDLPASDVEGSATFEIDVTTPGRIGLKVNDRTGITLPETLDLERGRHSVTMKVDGTARTGPIRVELVDLPGSPARATLVTGR